MFLSKASVNRPIAMTCFILTLILLGLDSYSKLGLDFFPDVSLPFVTITAVYPGASPNEIEVEVAKHLEDAFGTLDSLKNMDITCIENAASVMLEFQLGTNVDIAANDVRERLDQVRNDLPAALEAPIIKKFDISATPVVTLMLVGDLPVDQMYDYAKEDLSNKLSTIPGVGEVQISGGDDLELQIVVDKDKLNAAGITVSEVIAKLESSNLKIPAGRIRTGDQEISVTYDSEFKNFTDVGALEIGNKEGSRVYLRDIAAIRLQSKEKRSLAFYDGSPGIVLKVIKKGDANAVATIEGVQREIDRLTSQKLLPGGMELIWFRDSGSFIRASVDDAWSNVFMGVVLTALILFAFLHELRSTVIVVISMPVSIIVSFLAMRFFEYTFNTFTLLALGTGVGVLVTNSIVVIENIFKKLEQGLDPKSAADIGTAEVALPVFASAMTNVVVFVPIALMTSMVGRFLGPFAVTMTISTLVSLFMSFTLTPILAAQLLRRDLPAPNRVIGFIFKLWDIGYRMLERGFDATVGFVVRYPGTVVLLAIALFIVTVKVAQVGMSFVPEDDQNEFVVKLEFPTDFNLATTLARTMAIEKQVLGMPNVEHTSTVVGKVQGVIGQASEGVYMAEISIVTKPKGQREFNMDLDAVRQMLRQKLSGQPNCLVTVNIPSSVGGSSSVLEVSISGSDMDELNRLGLAAAELLRKSGNATDIDTSVRTGKPEIRVEPNRTALQNMGLSSAQIGALLRGSIEGIQAGTYKIGARSFDIRVKLEDRPGTSQVKEISFGSRDGRPLSIEALSQLRDSRMPIMITRSDRERIVKLYANPAPGVPLATLVSDLQRDLDELLPPGYRAEFGGQVEQMGESNADFANALLIAIVLTYLLIAAILESWVQPFLIMCTVPLGLIGLILALWWTSTPLSLFGLLGAVMLIGIVVNNAILIMDDVVVNRAKGLDGIEAMRLAVMNKFRPILMTSIAAILGILPMALGTGPGAESRASCGIPVVGGLVSSTVLSLYVIPALYIFFAKLKAWKKRRRNR